MKHWFPGLPSSEYLSLLSPLQGQAFIKNLQVDRECCTQPYIHLTSEMHLWGGDKVLQLDTSTLHSTATMSVQESLATHNSSPVAMVQSGFLSQQGQDKAEGPARALNMSTENSNHRIQAKESTGLKRRVQRKSSLFGKAGGAGSFQDKKSALCSSIGPHL